MFGLDAVYQFGLGFIAVFAAASFPFLFFVAAPYGRHNRPGWGPQMNANVAWVLMEAPPPILFTVVFLAGQNRGQAAPLALLALWMTHYSYRSFVYPFRLRSSTKRKPLLTVVLAVLFNCFNSFGNAYAISHLATHLDGRWLTDPRFVGGVVLFAAGYAVNHRADAVLMNLRAPGETGYKIPHGGFYRWVSSPNYLGEIIEWAGFAVAAWTLPALLFLLFSVANLVPRAVAHHRWYRERFPEYPPERKAIIPYAL